LSLVFRSSSSLTAPNTRTLQRIATATGHDLIITFCRRLIREGATL
jgi:hypothetical protein